MLEHRLMPDDYQRTEMITGTARRRRRSDYPTVSVANFTQGLTRTAVQVGVSAAAVVQVPATMVPALTLPGLGAAGMRTLRKRNR